ncbi:MAG: sigma-54 dependent transcriptional regulator [Sandaracinus sp.]
MSRVLVVDDEPGVLYMAREVLTDRGHTVIAAKSAQEALAHLEERIDVVLTDLAMPGMDGLALLEKVRERDLELPVILMTAHGNERVAVRAMKEGAYDYLGKPVNIDELGLVVERAAEARALRGENRKLAAEHVLGRRFVAESEPMRRLLASTERVAAKDVTVLVRGETGTGKELVASLVHASSKRKDKPLVRFNCAALPPELADAELFGHVKGAFTGAIANRTGFFAQANHGTLVLDEIGELPLGLQPKLLRALQEGEIQPVGSGRVEKVDVRIVACTNRDLLAEVKAGRFREDLYYRLAVVELVVPPLRERVEEIPALAREIARRHAEKFGVRSVVLSDALVEALTHQSWPGNVRQLENTLARVVALSSGGVLGPELLQMSAPLSSGASAHDDHDAPPPSTERATLREQVEAFERGLVARALEEAHGNQSEAARRLGVGRATLIDKMKKYGLSGRT